MYRVTDLANAHAALATTSTLDAAIATARRFSRELGVAVLVWDLAPSGGSRRVGEVAERRVVARSGVAHYLTACACARGGKGADSHCAHCRGLGLRPDVECGR